mmetsp:Transcript_31251/g.62539  ORF Transcript_31251/g.62539 Transcript_31251/m.62539 type:complete len:219 (-) Transcript_31251:548-1204(-)
MEGANVIFIALNDRPCQRVAQTVDLVCLKGDDWCRKTADNPNALQLWLAHVKDAWIHKELARLAVHDRGMQCRVRLVAALFPQNIDVTAEISLEDIRPESFTNVVEEALLVKVGYHLSQLSHGLSLLRLTKDAITNPISDAAEHSAHTLEEGRLRIEVPLPKGRLAYNQSSSARCSLLAASGSLRSGARTRGRCARARRVGSLAHCIFDRSEEGGDVH